jgi:hypothetical protein
MMICQQLVKIHFSIIKQYIKTKSFTIYIYYNLIQNLKFVIQNKSIIK